jgi:tetratricopeptide (TPR) repeat protein
VDNAFARAVVLLALACSACASPKAVVAPVRPAPSPRARLAAADAQVRAGCFDCLVSAFQEYDSLRSTPSVADEASIGAARSAALLAIRERELGTEDSGYLTRAREVGAANPAAQQALGVLLDIADTLPVRGGGRQVSDDVQLSRMQAAYRNRGAWTERLRAGADQDALSAYLWIGFSCAYTPSADQTLEQWLTSAPAWRETPLVTLKAATCGINIDQPTLERLLEADPRFVEIHYFLGLRLAFTGKIDAAMDHLLKAYAWRSRWPAVTSSLGVDYIALEEFEQAVEFFDRTLAVVPGDADALLNKIKALTYAGRYTESLETVERLLALEHWLVGDARYWRALNESLLGRIDEAWDDIELAAKLLDNAEVPKLAGTIAYRRKQLDVSREKFEQSRQRNRDDCETAFYLGVVLGDQAVWNRTADVLVEAAGCFEKTELKLNEEIAGIRASDQPPERQARQIRKREQQIASNRRTIMTSWYNIAVSYFSLSRTDDARQFAEKVVADEQLGERARELLTRLR